jgi:hypothetical protein
LKQEYYAVWLLASISLTAHSPVGIHPEKFGVKKKPIGTFANNDIDYIDSRVDHNKFSFGQELLIICIWFQLQIGLN